VFASKQRVFHVYTQQLLGRPNDSHVIELGGPNLFDSAERKSVQTPFHPRMSGHVPETVSTPHAIAEVVKDVEDVEGVEGGTVPV